MEKKKTFKQTIWAYFSSFVLLVWTVGLIHLLRKIPQAISTEATQELGGTLFFITVLGILLISLWRLLSIGDEEIRTLKFRIDESKYSRN